MRRICIQISEEWLERLAAIADIERRDVRIQAICILESGIAQMEMDHGLTDPLLPPRIIDAEIGPSSFGAHQSTQNGAGRVRQDTLASAFLP